MLLKLLMGLGVVALFAAQAVQAGDVTNKLIGNYQLVSGKRGTLDVPKDKLDVTMRITPEVITTFDKDHKEVYVIKYTIDSGDEPSRISMTVTRSSMPEAVNQKAKGLIKASGDTVTLIYDFKGEDYPKGFEPRGDTQNMFVMKRSPEK